MQDSNNVEQNINPNPQAPSEPSSSSPSSPSSPSMTIDKPKNGKLIGAIIAILVLVVGVIGVFALIPKDKSGENTANNSTSGGADKKGNDKPRELEPITIKYGKGSIVLESTLGDTLKGVSKNYSILQYVADEGFSGHDEVIDDLDSYLKLAADSRNLCSPINLGSADGHRQIGVQFTCLDVDETKTVGELPYSFWMNTELWTNGDVYIDDLGPINLNTTTDDLEKMPVKFTRAKYDDGDGKTYEAEYKNRKLRITIVRQEDAKNDYTILEPDNIIYIKP